MTKNQTTAIAGGGEIKKNCISAALFCPVVRCVSLLPRSEWGFSADCLLSVEYVLFVACVLSVECVLFVEYVLRVARGCGAVAA